MCTCAIAKWLYCPLCQTLGPMARRDEPMAICALIPAGAFAATEESAPTKGKRVPGKWQLLQVSYNAVYDETTVQ